MDQYRLRVNVLLILWLASMLTAQTGPASDPSKSLSLPIHQSLAAQKQAPSNCSGQESARSPVSGHSVLLSWNASVPATTLSRDAVIGYIVYRSHKAHDAKASPINIQRLMSTSCVDMQIQPGETYFYVTRAVSASGALSGPSNEIRVQIPRSVSSANEDSNSAIGNTTFSH